MREDIDTHGDCGMLGCSRWCFGELVSTRFDPLDSLSPVYTRPFLPSVGTVGVRSVSVPAPE